MNRPTRTLALVLPLACVPLVASAQDEPTPVGPTSPQGGDTQVNVTPPSSTTTFTPAGPGPGEVDKHLPSSSQSLTDINQSKDTFDLNRQDPAAASARGGKGGQYVLEGGGVPQAHSVRRGDTLWGISGQYFRNPYQWPRLWAHNPQIQNPHWIYPGDRVRLRSDEGKGLLPRTVPESTVFLREYGWVDDPEKDSVGEVVGSPEDHMMLAHIDDVYIELKADDDVKVELGQELTIFREIRTMRGREADDSGELVSVLGTARVDRFNPKTRMIRAHLIESLDVIERGDLVGQVGRKFLIIPPVRNEKYLEARILTALYPHQFFGQHQVVFLDRGKRHGVKPGNRFIAVRRGDRWVETLDFAGPAAEDRPMTEDDRDAVFGDLKTDGPEEKYPNETYAEIRVLAVRDKSCIAIVMESMYEIERDSILVMKKGH